VKNALTGLLTFYYIASVLNKGELHGCGINILPSVISALSKGSPLPMFFMNVAMFNMFGSGPKGIA
jgi:hypothetical protein